MIWQEEIKNIVRLTVSFKPWTSPLRSVLCPCSSSVLTSQRKPPTSASLTSSPTRTLMKALWVWPTSPRPNSTSLEVSAPKVKSCCLITGPKFPSNIRYSLKEWFWCFCSQACPSSSNEQRAIYLNTGLTSTKNYGKTILTKVGGSSETVHTVTFSWHSQFTELKSFPYCLFTPNSRNTVH